MFFQLNRRENIPTATYNSCFLLFKVSNSASTSLSWFFIILSFDLSISILSLSLWSKESSSLVFSSTIEIHPTNRFWFHIEVHIDRRGWSRGFNSCCGLICSGWICGRRVDLFIHHVICCSIWHLKYWTAVHIGPGRAADVLPFQSSHCLQCLFWRPPISYIHIQFFAVQFFMELIISAGDVWACSSALWILML